MGYAGAHLEPQVEGEQPLLAWFDDARRGDDRCFTRSFDLRAR